MPVYRCHRCGNVFEANICDACKQRIEFTRLTPRESQLVACIRANLLNKEIAYELQIAEGSVKQYLSLLYRKLKVRDRTGLAIWTVLHVIEPYSKQSIPNRQEFRT